MFASRPAVCEDGLVRAAGFFEGIRQYGHVAEIAAVVHPLGHRHQQTVMPKQPGGIEEHGLERIAKNVAEDGDLPALSFGVNIRGIEILCVQNDVPFQGIAREGGARFVRNKKPERLLARILSLQTDPGDWVLDPFLGSGTTALAAEMEGFVWVGIEREPEYVAIAEARLNGVQTGMGL